MFKTIFKGIIIVAIIFTVFGTVGHLETHYTQKGVITEVNENNNEVTIIDETDNEWTFYGTGYTENEQVKIKFHTNFTDNKRTDDTIKNVKAL